MERVILPPRRKADSEYPQGKLIESESVFFVCAASSGRHFETMPRKLFFAPLMAALLMWGGVGMGTGAESPVRPANPGGEIFTNAVFRRIILEITPGDLAELRKDPRKTVQATLREGGTNYPSVGLHLKGSTGSFRGVDERPSLTLNFDRFIPAQRFHGLSRIHLNNSVEDPTYLHEWLGGEMFRAAGVPAPRAGHALVELNGRNLGLYVLKEGFTGIFSRCISATFAATCMTRVQGTM